MVVICTQPGIACLKPVAFWALAIALSALPIRAQRGTHGRMSSSYGQPPMLPGTEPGVFIPTMEPLLKPVVVEDESCLPWELPSVRGATVSAVRLGVPSKARNLYEKACGAFKKRKLTEAEQYVREAIQTYSNYLAAWVMLGQVLQSEQKIDEAHEACSKALSVDPTYLPPYLC
jgi:tetratricopeptide (TPR) repeat protein